MPWWKQVIALDDDDQLNRFWAHFLKKANASTKLASHSHLDLLYSLVQVKHHLILQLRR
jgi:hypothetical protein